MKNTILICFLVFSIINSSIANDKNSNEINHEKKYEVTTATILVAALVIAAAEELGVQLVKLAFKTKSGDKEDLEKIKNNQKLMIAYLQSLQIDVKFIIEQNKEILNKLSRLPIQIEELLRQKEVENSSITIRAYQTVFLSGALKPESVDLAELDVAFQKILFYTNDFEMMYKLIEYSEFILASFAQADNYNVVKAIYADRLRLKANEVKSFIDSKERTSIESAQELLNILRSEYVEKSNIDEIKNVNNLWYRMAPEKTREETVTEQVCKRVPSGGLRGSGFTTECHKEKRTITVSDNNFNNGLREKANKIEELKIILNKQAKELMYMKEIFAKTFIYYLASLETEKLKNIEYDEKLLQIKTKDDIKMDMLLEFKE